MDGTFVSDTLRTRMPRPRQTFTGEFEAPLRRRGGDEVLLRLPAAWRAPGHCGADFLAVAIEGGIRIYSPQGTERLLRKANRLNKDDEQVRLALRRVFGNACQVPCDETHTLAFDETFIRSTRLGTTARLIGHTHYFEISPLE